MNPARNQSDLALLALGSAAILLISFIIYIPSLQGEFVFDDVIMISDNSVIQSDTGLRDIWWSTELNDYFPLTSTTFWIEWRIWGAKTAGYHFFNVLLHGIGAVLLWRVFLRLKIPGAWLAALVFAVHPICAPSVAWISERKNTLSMVFFMLTVLSYLRFDQNQKAGGAEKWYWGSVAMFLLALLSKTSVVMLPVVLLGYAWWRRGRISWHDVARSVPFFLLSLILGLVTVWFQFYRASGGEAVDPATFLERTIGATWALWFYIGKAIWPANLSPLYAQWSIDATSPLSYLPALALIGAAAVAWKYRAGWGRHALFAVGYFVAMVLPVLGFFNMYFFTYARVADHWIYLSLIGVVALVVGGIVHVSGTLLRVRPGCFDGRIATIGAALVLVLSVLTWNYAGAYSNEETLWRYTLERNPKAWAAQNNLGLIMEERGEWNAAEAHYKAALSIKPDFAKAHYNLGLLSERLGRQTEAAHHYSEAIRIQPNYAECHNNLAILLFHQNRNEEAVEHYLKALEFRRDFALAHYNLSFSLLKLDRRDEAIEHLRKALALRPDHTDAAIQLEQLVAEAGPIP